MKLNKIYQGTYFCVACEEDIQFNFFFHVEWCPCIIYWIAYPLYLSVINQIPIYVWANFWAFYSAPLTCFSYPVPISHCINYFSFIKRVISIKQVLLPSSAGASSFFLALYISIQTVESAHPDLQRIPFGVFNSIALTTWINFENVNIFTTWIFLSMNYLSLHLFKKSLKSSIKIFSFSL